MPVILDLSMVDSNVAAVLGTLHDQVKGKFEHLRNCNDPGREEIAVPLRYVNLCSFKIKTLDFVVVAAYIAAILLAIF
jgi:hypothetical protein